MIVATCPKCEKQLNLPETSRGKRVRCMGCQAIVLVDAPAAPEPPPVPKFAPRSESGVEYVETTPVGEPDPVPDAVVGLRCASCQSTSVQELPPDANSRKPGYICAMCRTVMRPAGSATGYYAAMLIGAVIVLFGAGLVYVSLEAKEARTKLVGGGAAVAALGLAVAGWAFMQARLPVPIGAEPAPPRIGFWIAVVVMALVLAAGGVLGLMYVKKELM